MVSAHINSDFYPKYPAEEFLEIFAINIGLQRVLDDILRLGWRIASVVHFRLSSAQPSGILLCGDPDDQPWLLRLSL